MCISEFAPNGKASVQSKLKPAERDMHGLLALQTHTRTQHATLSDTYVADLRTGDGRWGGGEVGVDKRCGAGGKLGVIGGRFGSNALWRTQSRPRVRARFRPLFSAVTGMLRKSAHTHARTQSQLGARTPNGRRGRRVQ